MRSEFPQFGGRLQPYLAFVPKTYPRTRRAGITFALHSLSATYTQFAVFSPNQQRQLGDDEGRFYVTPLGRGPDGWYTDEAEVDFFEVWADLARHFRLDPTRVALSGYSMGGYGTYKLGLQWPDLFGAAFTTVGPPLARRVPEHEPAVENARWVPFLNWAGRTDALVPIAAVRAQQQRFDELNLRSQPLDLPGRSLQPRRTTSGMVLARSWPARSSSATPTASTTRSYRPPTAGGSVWSTITPTGCRTCAPGPGAGQPSAPAASPSGAGSTPSPSA